MITTNSSQSKRVVLKRHGYVPLILALAGAAVWGCTADVDYPTGAPGSKTTPEANDPKAPAGEAGAGSSADPNDPAAEPTNDCALVKEHAKQILQDNCASCHGEGKSAGNFDFVLDTPKLIDTGKIKIGDPQGSPLYNLVATKAMPPASVAKKPSDDDVGVLYEWIGSCLAPAGGSTNPTVPGTSCERVDTRKMLQWMIDDMSLIDLEDRPFIRYFTLTHLHNAGTCGEALDTHRYALAKAVNATSQGTQIVAPQPIDKFNTVFRIDLRDYDWDVPSLGSNNRDKWEDLVEANPYAIELLQDEAEVLQLFSQTRVPFQHGDWFVNAGTQPPLYHQILNIPETLGELEQQLGINIANNIAREEVWRAGFLDSGVSVQNRVIERHEIPVSNARSFWISYDFAGNGGDENIFANPLDFEPDGSEVIFTLPNGLHAYMVAQADGQRLDVAPTVIVVDPKQDDNNVRNGISCMSCHDIGMKAKNDELREYVENSSDFDEDTKEAIADLHPSREEFSGLINRDTAVFQDALKQLDPPTSVNGEPIIAAFKEFDQNVDLERAAAELGIRPQTLLTELGGLSPELAPLAYGAIKRDTFKEKFAEIVCVLKIGLADDDACDNNR